MKRGSSASIHSGGQSSLSFSITWWYHLSPRVGSKGAVLSYTFLFLGDWLLSESLVLLTDNLGRCLTVMQCSMTWPPSAQIWSAYKLEPVWLISEQLIKWLGKVIKLNPKYFLTWSAISFRGIILFPLQTPSAVIRTLAFASSILSPNEAAENPPNC